jgi:hypothetical protein
MRASPQLLDLRQTADPSKSPSEEFIGAICREHSCLSTRWSYDLATRRPVADSRARPVRFGSALAAPRSWRRPVAFALSNHGAGTFLAWAPAAYSSLGWPRGRWQ